jgi:hypothetical protein
MRTLIRLTLLGTGLLAGAALLRRWLEEQPGMEAPAQPGMEAQAPAQPVAPPQPATPTTVTSPPPDRSVAATRKELYERARELDIEGRSKMTKQQLADAVHRAESP